jgi:hypothetical protein
MRFTDDETGEVHRPFPTEELAEDLRRLEASFLCEHRKTELRERVVSNGAIQIREQCLECGIARGQARKKYAAPGNLHAFDETLEPAFSAARELARKRILLRHLKLQEEGNASHQKEYDAYLASPQWSEKRRKVIERAGGVCEGCRDKPAEDVHHLTYEHIYNEFLFELVALCRSCHERVHETQPNLSEDAELPCCGCRYQSEMRHQPWCGKFEVSARSAIAEQGHCGPDHLELEPMK